NNYLLNIRLRSAEQHLSEADPILAKLITSYGPCTLKPHRPYFYVLCDSIVSQQLSVKAANTIMRRFRALYGPGHFPSPAEVLSTPDEKLTGVGFSRAKALYVKNLAEKFHSGALKS